MEYTTKIDNKQMSNPWGHVNSRVKITGKSGKSIYAISTPSHGGYAVSRKWAEDNIPRFWLEKLFASPDDNYYFFEEDCDWSILAFECPEFFPDEACDQALHTLKHFHLETMKEHYSDIL